MTPAEKLSAKKPWRREPRNKTSYTRKLAWREPALRETREGLRLSMRDVAEAVGMSIACYWQLEKGGDPMLTTATKIAAFYGKRVDEIWSERA